MGQDAREVGAQRLEDEQSKSPEQLRAEIEDTRAELGDTVEALAAKTDVKTRARERADELKHSAVAKKDELLAKAKQASPSRRGEGDGGAAGPAGSRAGQPKTDALGSALEQLKSRAEQNPVPTAALAAFVGGVAVGRLSARR